MTHMEPTSSSRNRLGEFDAQNHFGALLDRVERGEVIVITRNGRAVAQLSPCEEAVDRARARAAAERLMRFGDDEPNRLPRGVTVADLISGGRG